MGFIRIKIFNDFCNIIFSKRDSWKKVICSFKGIGRKFPSIFNQRALLSKEIVEDLSLQSYNCYYDKLVEYNVFFCYLKKISLLTSTPSGLQWDPLTYSGFENKIVLLIFQLWQLGDSVCTCIFEKIEYLCYFGNKTSWQYSSSVFCYLFMGNLDHHKWQSHVV